MEGPFEETSLDDADEDSGEDGDNEQVAISKVGLEAGGSRQARCPITVIGPSIRGMGH